MNNKAGQNHQRQTNIELLRIICMVSILMGHYVGKGGIVTTSHTIYQKVSLIFWGGGKLGVNIFALIMGYFGAVSVKNQGKKIINLYLQVVSYSVVSVILYVIFAKQEISMAVIKQTVFPVSTNMYWFITCTLGIYLLQPYINIILEKVDRSKFSFMLIVLLVMFSVIPTLVYKENPYFSNIGWLLTLYCIGYYINKFQVAVSSGISILIFGGMWIIMWLLDILLETYTGMEVNYFSYMYRIPMFAASVFLFLFFVNRDIQYNQYINRIAKSVLGVYLLHDCLFFRNYFWKFAGAQKYYMSFGFLGHMLLCSLILFVLGIVVEKAREKIFAVTVYKTKFYCKMIEGLNRRLE